MSGCELHLIAQDLTKRLSGPLARRVESRQWLWTHRQNALATKPILYGRHGRYDCRDTRVPPAGSSTRPVESHRAASGCLPERPKHRNDRKADPSNVAKSLAPRAAKILNHVGFLPTGPRPRKMPRSSVPADSIDRSPGCVGDPKCLENAIVNSGSGTGNVATTHRRRPDAAQRLRPLSDPLAERAGRTCPTRSP